VIRKLTLKIDRLTELTSDELTAVAGAQQKIVSELICITDMLTVCDAQRCAI
jgi:hypothetical protein